MLGTRWCCGRGADGLRPPNFGFLERAGCQIWGFGQGFGCPIPGFEGLSHRGVPARAQRRVPPRGNLPKSGRNWGEIGVKLGRNWGEIASFAAPPAAQAAAVGLERGKGSRPPAAGALRLILGGKIWPKIRCRGQARCRCSAFSRAPPRAPGAARPRAPERSLEMIWSKTRGGGEGGRGGKRGAGAGLLPPTRHR